MVNEVKKEHDVVNVRLENIKLKNKLKKKEQQLKSKVITLRNWFYPLLQLL